MKTAKGTYKYKVILIERRPVKIPGNGPESGWDNFDGVSEKAS